MNMCAEGEEKAEGSVVGEDLCVSFLKLWILSCGQERVWKDFKQARAIRFVGGGKELRSAEDERKN